MALQYLGDGVAETVKPRQLGDENEAVADAHEGHRGASAQSKLVPVLLGNRELAFLAEAAGSQVFDRWCVSVHKPVGISYQTPRGCVYEGAPGL